MKQLITAAALVAALASFDANATMYDFSYNFGDGSVLTGSLSGELQGDYVQNISDVHVSLNGAEFSSPLAFAGQLNATTHEWDFAAGALISTDASKNNFVFSDSGSAVGEGALNYFLFTNDPDPAVGQQVFALNLGNNASAFDLPANGTWSLTAAAPVPLPAAGVLLMSGLGLFGGMGRRRRARAADECQTPVNAIA